MEGASSHKVPMNSVSAGKEVYKGATSPVKKNYLSILYYNACSLLPKLEHLAATCLACNPDIVCIVESWRCDDVCDGEISLPNYSVVRLDRNQHGGGIVLYIKDTLSFSVVSAGPESLEIIFVSVSLPTNRSICLGTFYRPHLLHIIFLILCSMCSVLLILLYVTILFLLATLMSIGQYNPLFVHALQTSCRHFC